MGMVGSKARIIRSQVRWLGAVLKDHLSAQWFWEVRQLICPTTFATRLFRLDWLMLCSLWISNFFDSWFGAGARASFSGSASWLRRKCFSHFPWFDWFTASSAASVVMGFGALIALA